MKGLVRRSYPAQYRADSDTGIIEGVPIVFDTPTDIGGWFEETICKGAIDEDKLTDVRLFWNHNIDEKAVARTIIPLDKLGGMELHVSDEKVKMMARPNRSRTDANDLFLAIEDGVISSMSFMFGVEEERWEDLDTDYPKRFITKINPVVEVSAVNFPAYATTSINARGESDVDNARAVLDQARQKRDAETEISAQQQARADLELLKAKYEYLF